MSENQRIYLDHAATSRLRPEVLEAMQSALSEQFGNASSVHKEGQKARKILEECRDSVAKCLGCHPSEIYFTSGGTESDNWAILSLAEYAAIENPSKRRVITSPIEHPAVIESCRYLERHGFEVIYLPVDQYGLVSPDALTRALTPETCLVSIMYANNEIGTIEPISELVDLAHQHGALFHTDAVQAVGTVPVSFHELNVDAGSFSSHKFGGPTGIGGLYLKNSMKIPSLMLGGSQEYGLRAGTENVLGVVGLSKALEISCAEMISETARLSNIRNQLIHEVLSTIPSAKLCGHPTDRLPGHAHFVFDGVEGEALLLYLNLEGYACSSGAACSSGSHESSHVLQSIGLTPSLLRSALRITIGHENTIEDVLSIVPVLQKLVDRLQTRR